MLGMSSNSPKRRGHSRKQRGGRQQRLLFDTLEFSEQPTHTCVPEIYILPQAASLPS